MDYQQIIEKLKKQGKITEEDIAIASTTSDDIHSLAILMHSIICNEKHLQLEEFALGMSGCPFYAEEQTDNTWELKAHMNWNKIAEEFNRLFPEWRSERDEVVKICNLVILLMNPETKEAAEILKELIRLYK
jgi:hypothetical protein